MASLPPGITREQIAILKEQNHDAEIITIVALFTALAVLATVLRLTSRHMKKNAVGVDDMLILFGLVCSVAESIYISVGARSYGVGRHMLTLTPQQLVGFQKLWFTVGLLQPTALMVTKLSVLILFYRVFIQRRFRLSVWIVAGIVVAWWIGTFLADLLVCIPIESRWKPRIKSHCGNRVVLGWATPIPWIATDLAILLMPLPMVWKLHLPVPQRIGLAGLFLLGGFALISSCVRYSTVFFQHEDATWYIVPAAIWTVIECNVTIVSACLIVSRPWFLKIYPGKTISTIRKRLLSSRHSEEQGQTATKDPQRWKLPVSSFKPLPDTPPQLAEKTLGGSQFHVDLESQARNSTLKTHRDLYDG